MVTFLMDLPYAIPLQDGEYAAYIRGVKVTIAHTIVKHEQLDPRLGAVTGSFGFALDQLGILRHSKLSFMLGASELEHLERSFFGALFEKRNLDAQTIKTQVALAVCNHFLDKYRSVTKVPYVRSLGEGDLARLTFTDEFTRAEIRLYGGGITLPIAGLSENARAQFVQTLAAEDEPYPFELDSFDAIWAAKSGRPREAETLAVGTLESALDLYFSRSWRSSVPLADRVATAADELDVKRSKKKPKHFTVEDLLRDAGVGKKLDAFTRRSQLDNTRESQIRRAIEARNVVVHGGVSVPATMAEEHASRIAAFLRQDLKPALERDSPPLPKAEFLYAFEEATGSPSPAGLQQIGEHYLGSIGVSAFLYHEREADLDPSSEHFGTVMLMRVPFNNPQMTPAHISLLLARMIVRFSHRFQGTFALAQVSPQLPNEETRPYWAFIDQELNKAVWDVAVDRAIMAHGLIKEVQSDIQGRANQLRAFYSPSYAPPGEGEVRNHAEYMRLARIAAVLPETQRTDLLASAAEVAPRVAAQAKSVLTALENVSFDEPGTILEGLVQLHDASLILASVAVYDPVAGRFYGAGVNSGK